MIELGDLESATEVGGGMARNDIATGPLPGALGPGLSRGKSFRHTNT